MWKVRYLKTVLGFRIDLFRKRFSIYGVSNIIAFMVFMLSGIFLPRFALVKIGHYDKIIALLTIIYFTLLIEVVVKEVSEKDKNLVRTFFDRIDMAFYENYMRYYKFILYQIVYCYLLFPYHEKDIFLFLTAITGFEVLTAFFIFIYHAYSPFVFHMVRQVVIVGASIVIILSARGLICVPEIPLSDSRIVWFESFLLVVSIIVSVKNTGIGAGHKYSKLLGRLCTLRCVTQNKDFVFVIRRNKWVEPVFVLIISMTISLRLNEGTKDSMLTYLTAFSYWFYYIYIELIKYESGKYGLLYAFHGIAKMKKEKIQNTVLIAACLFLLVLVPLLFAVAPSVLIVTFAISVVMFAINSRLVRFSFEKGRGYGKTVSESEQLVYILVFIVEIFVVSFILL